MDEGLVLGVAAFATLVFLIGWLMIVASRWPAPLRGPGVARPILAVTPVTCLAGLYAVVRYCAAADVRASAEYQLLFVCVGVAFLGVAVGAGHVMGLSVRDDAIDRANKPAAVALAGAMVGMTLAYAGANVGAGDTIWTTLGPAALAAAVLLCAWLGVERAAGTSDAIAIDRDAASAVRLAGLLVACGAILGRAAAGDYESVAGTLRDLAAIGWPVAVLAAAAAAAQRACRPTGARPRPNVWRFGIAPAAVLLLAAGAWIAAMGRVK